MTNNNLITNSAIELSEDLDVSKKGKGRKFVSRFIESGVAHYKEFGDVLITKETLDKFIHTMVGCPVIINHKDISDKNVEKERVGVISNVWYEPLDGWYYCDGIIWDKDAIALVKNEHWNVSCSYDFKTDFESKTHNGKKIDMEFTDGEFLHLALVDTPRYERANIVVNSEDIEMNVENDDKWITIKPNGEDAKGKHLLLKDGETPEEAIDRVYKKDGVKDKDVLDKKAPEKKEKTYSFKDKKYTAKQLVDEGFHPMKYGASIFKDDKLTYLEKTEGKMLYKVPISEEQYRELSKYKQDKKGEERQKNLYKKADEGFEVTKYFKDKGTKDRGYKFYKGDLDVFSAPEPQDDLTRDEYINILKYQLSKEPEYKIKKGKEDFELLKDGKVISHHQDSFRLKPQLERLELRQNQLKSELKKMGVKMNKVENGFITVDAGTENERVVWIPENVHWVAPKEKSRVLSICDAYKQGDETKLDFSHTKVKPTEPQINYLKGILNSIKDAYQYKGVAQLEISSSLNSGSWGVCFAPENTSLISISPSMYKEDAQSRYDDSVEDGFHPRGTGDCIKSVLVHELGHAITCNSGNAEFWDKIDTIRRDYLKNIKSDDIEKPDFISNYARQNKYEFVAEAFCQGTLSKEYGKYTKQVMDLMKDNFSKNVQKKLFNKADKEEKEMWIEGFGFGYPIDASEYEDFKDEKETQKKKEQKANNSEERKENLTMTVLNELENFVRTIVENKCSKKEVENEKDDKRKLIDEVAGMLKSAGADDEVIRTAIGKMEKIAYEKSEDGTADNKKDLKEEKFDEEKEIVENEVIEVEEEEVKDEEDIKKDDKKEVKEEVKEDAKIEEKADKKEKVDNSIDKAKEIIYNGVKSEVKHYATKDERLELGNNY